MRTPKFWEKDGLLPRLLSPASFLYKSATAARVKKPGYRAKVPVVCIGNLTAGGAGKTPTTIALATALKEQGRKPHIISRGYGGSFEGVVKVGEQSPKIVGDEPILLSQTATTWVAEDRAAAAKAAEESGADIILMDDGFQNPDVEKDFSLLVFDGGFGIGNGRVIPAGPLREPVAEGMKRADAVLVIGNKEKELPKFDVPVFSAKIEIEYDPILKNEDIVAFCGIGRPGKFFASLKESGLKLVDEMEYPDHHFYTEEELKRILAVASEKSAMVVTTEKDMVKIPAHLHMMVNPVIAKLRVKNIEKLVGMIKKAGSS